eukprot:6697838-Pyramimonas_sp.AAC.1
MRDCLRAIGAGLAGGQVHAMQLLRLRVPAWRHPTIRGHSQGGGGCTPPGGVHLPQGTGARARGQAVRGEGIRVTKQVTHIRNIISLYIYAHTQAVLNICKKGLWGVECTLAVIGIIGEPAK